MSTANDYETLTGIRPTSYGGSHDTAPTAAVSPSPQASQISRTNPKEYKIEDRIHAANVIKRAWRSYKYCKTFKWAKLNLYRAERSLTNEVLRRLSPKEGQLLSDPIMHARVRFRFGGATFPPKIMYKIYTKGVNVHYFSGCKMISPGSKAAEDACMVMGSRAFQEGVYFDERQHRVFKIGRHYEVTDKMEFVQYMNSLDHKAPHLGGRNNGWRELSIAQFSQQPIHFDLRKPIAKANMFSGVARIVAAQRPVPSRHTADIPTVNVTSDYEPRSQSVYAHQEPQEPFTGADIEPVIKHLGEEIGNDDFGLLFEWTNRLNVDHLRDYVVE